jgi:GT2 family glycosyltransferase
MKEKTSINPEISVILVAPDHYSTVRKTITHLLKQTALDRLELVIVAPSADHLDADESELGAFPRVQIAEIGDLITSARATAIGIRRASAEIVALVEDHAFPEPGWAAALIDSHRQPWAAVGPVVRNGNPDKAISWADFLIGYGPWIAPAPAGAVDHLPGHNSSYKRSLLLKFGTDLEELLEAETLLHWNLREKGYKLYLEPRAITSHVNFSLFSSWIQAQYHSGRVFAAARIHGMSKLKQALFIGGAPLIPFVRFLRIFREMCKPGRFKMKFFSVMPILFVGLSINGFGQMLGYAFSAGNSKDKMAQLEFHRDRHVSKRDKLSVYQNRI